MDWLEPRIALSTIKAGAAEVAGHAPGLRGARTTLPGPRAGFGVLGDSLSDEYRNYPPDRSHARNWVEILAQTRRANFGPYSAVSRGEPRNRGYAFDWARSDAASSDMVANQLPGLVRQVARGQVKYASVLIGENDYIQAVVGLATTSPTPEAVASRLAATTATLTSNFDKAVNDLLVASPNLRLAVATLPDVTRTPAAQLLSGVQGAAELTSAVRQATGVFNDHVRAVAAGNPRVALVDLAARFQTWSGTTQTTFGGRTIDLVRPGDDDHHLYLADLLHPGTVGQGVIANEVVSALDAKFGARFAPVAPTRIVRLAARVARSAG